MDSSVVSKLKEIFDESRLDVVEHHKGSVCQSCERKDFYDFRYKCLECNNYDLCGLCFETRRTSKDHKLSHPMILVFKSLSPEKNQLLDQIIQEKDKLLKETAKINIFEGSECKICKVSPIKGIKIKCDICINFDMCWDCFGSGEEHEKHSKDHPTVVFLLPRRNICDIKSLEDCGELGGGQFGDVRLVKCPNNQQYALKTIIVDPTDKKSLSDANMKSCHNEVQGLTELYSSTIVKYYESQTEEKDGKKYHYILMEYMQNGSLHTFLKKIKLDKLRRFNLVLLLIRGIRRMHKKDLYTRILNPKMC